MRLTLRVEQQKIEINGLQVDNLLLTLINRRMKFGNHETAINRIAKNVMKELKKMPPNNF